MINYKLGANLDLALIDGVVELNSKFKELKINEFFGSDRQHAYLTARPEFRLPDVSKKDFENFIKRCNENDIEFNYTMNAINPGSKEFLLYRKTEILKFIKYLEDIGVKRITIANLLLGEFIRSVSNIPIEISTIMHVDTVTQIQWLYDNFKVDKICGSILKNRNIKFLKNAAILCKKLGIKYEILVNEFCGNGGGDGVNAYGTTCSLRDNCYILHNSNKTKQDAMMFNTYPMGYCMGSRNKAASWLKMRFVLPQDIMRYVNIGITNFKISGRTGTTEYLLFVAQKYMEQNFTGNLLELWKPLETIYSEQKETEYKHPYVINCEKLTKEKFIDYWFEREDHQCENEICGQTCQYCNLIYERVEKNEK